MVILLIVYVYQVVVSTALSKQLVIFTFKFMRTAVPPQLLLDYHSPYMARIPIKLQQCTGGSIR